MQEGGSCLRRTGTKTQKYAVIKLEGDQVVLEKDTHPLAVLHDLRSL